MFCFMLYLYSTCGHFQGGWFNKKKKFKKRQKKIFNSFALWQVLQIALPDLLILLKKQKTKLRNLNFS